MAPTTRIVCRVAAALGAPLLVISLTAGPAVAGGDLPGETGVLDIELEDSLTGERPQSVEVTGLDTDGLGQVFVAESANHVVLRAEEQASPAVEWGTGSPRDPGAGDDDEQELLEPQDVAVAENGDVFVAEADGAIRVSTSNGGIEQLVAAGDLTDDGTELALAAGEDGLYIGDGDGVITHVDYDDPEDTEEFAELDYPITGLADAGYGEVYAAVGHAIMSVTSSGHDEFGSVELEEAIPAATYEDTLVAQDVAVGPDSALVAVGLYGLIVFDGGGYIESLRPHLTGLAITADDNGIWVSGEGSLHTMSWEDTRVGTYSPTDNVFPTPQPGSVQFADTAPDSGHLSQVTSLSSGQEPAALAVGPSGRLILPTAQGVLEADTEGATSEWAERQTNPDTDSQAFVAADGSLFLLHAGELTVTRPNGDQTMLPVGFSGTDIPETANSDRNISAMASSDRQLFLASGSYVYALDSHGFLSRYPESDSEFRGRIHTMAATPEGDLYVAHEAQDRVIVSRLDYEDRFEEATEVFDSDDVDDAFLPTGMAVDGDTLYVTDEYGDRVLRHTGSGSPEVVAGGQDAELAASAESTTAADTELSDPHSPVVDSAGTLLFVSDGQVLAIPDVEFVSRTLVPTVVISLASIVALGVAGGVLLYVRRRLGTH